MVTTYTPSVSSGTVKPISFSTTSLNHNPFKVLATQQHSVSTSVVALNTTVNKLYKDVKTDISSDSVDKRQDDLGEEKWRDEQSTADAKVIKLLKEISDGLKKGSGLLPNLPIPRVPGLPRAPGRGLPKVSPKGALGVAGKALGVLGLGTAAYSAMNMSDNDLAEYGGSAGLGGRLVAFTRKFADTATFGLSEKLSSTINESIEGTNIGDNIGRSVAVMFSLFDKGAAETLKNDPVISGLKSSVSDLAGNISKSSSAILGTTTAFLANAAGTVGDKAKELWNNLTGSPTTPATPKAPGSLNKATPPVPPVPTSFIEKGVNAARNVGTAVTGAVGDKAKELWNNLTGSPTTPKAPASHAPTPKVTKPATPSASGAPGHVSDGMLNLKESIHTSGYQNNFNKNKKHIIEASKLTGVDAGLLTSIALSESGMNEKAGADSSSAKGLFQFTKDTWSETLQTYGKKYGFGPSTSVFNARANAILGAEYVKYNSGRLKKFGHAIDPANLYFAHFLGSTGGPKFLRFLKEKPNEHAYKSFADASNSNPNIFFVNENRSKPRTFKQIYDLMLNNKIKKHSYADAVTEVRKEAGGGKISTAVDSTPVAPPKPATPAASKAVASAAVASTSAPKPAPASGSAGPVVTSGLLKSATAINDATKSKIQSGKLKLVANVGKKNTTKTGYDGRKDYFSYSGSVTPRSTAIGNLDSTVRHNLNNLAYEYKQATGSTLNVTTGARTYAQQKHFWDLYQAGKGNPANRPGYSLHEYGLAVDISPAQVKKAESLGLLKKFGFYRPLPNHPKEQQHIQPTSVAASALSKAGDTQVAPPPVKAKTPSTSTPPPAPTTTAGKAVQVAKDVAKATGVTAVATAVTQKVDDVKTGVMEDASKPAEERSGNMVLAALKSLGIDGLEPAEGEEGSLLQHAAKVVTDLASLGVGVTKNVMSNMMDPTLNQREAIDPGVPAYLSPTKVAPVKTFDTVVKDVVNKYNPLKSKVTTTSPTSPPTVATVSNPVDTVTAITAPVVNSVMKAVDAPAVTSPQVKVESTSVAPTPAPVAVTSTSVNSEMELPSMKSPEVQQSDAKIPESTASKGNDSTAPTSNAGQNNSKVTDSKDDLMIKSGELLLFNLGVFA